MGTIYLFPPPTTSIMLRVVLKLMTFWGTMLLVVPLWHVQLWHYSAGKVSHSLPFAGGSAGGVHIATTLSGRGASCVEFLRSVLRPLWPDRVTEDYKDLAGFRPGTHCHYKCAWSSGIVITSAPGHLSSLTCCLLIVSRGGTGTGHNFCGSLGFEPSYF